MMNVEQMKNTVVENRKKIVIGAIAALSIAGAVIGIKHLSGKISAKTMSDMADNAGAMLNNAVDNAKPLEISMAAGKVVEAMEDSVDAGVVLEGVDIEALGDVGAQMMGAIEGVDYGSVCNVAVTAAKVAE